jgi:hypothetical protein
MDVIPSPTFRHPFQPSDADGNSNLHFNQIPAQVLKFNELIFFFRTAAVIILHKDPSSTSIPESVWAGTYHAMKTSTGLLP